MNTATANPFSTEPRMTRTAPTTDDAASIGAPRSRSPGIRCELADKALKAAEQACQPGDIPQDARCDHDHRPDARVHHRRALHHRPRIHSTKDQLDEGKGVIVSWHSSRLHWGVILVANHHRLVVGLRSVPPSRQRSSRCWLGVADSNFDSCAVLGCGQTCASRKTRNTHCPWPHALGQCAAGSRPVSPPVSWWTFRF